LVAVDKIQAFHTFLSTSEAAQADFGGGGRQNSGISLVFCLLWRARAPGLEATVDKIRAFRSFFVYFEGRARRVWRLR